MCLFVGGPQEKMSNRLWTNSEYPILLKSMSIWSLQSSIEKNDPFLTYDPPKVSVFLALVTGLVTDLIH
jgi:hypothetical protein